MNWLSSTAIDPFVFQSLHLHVGDSSNDREFRQRRHSCNTRTFESLLWMFFHGANKAKGSVPHFFNWTKFPKAFLSFWMVQCMNCDVTLDSKVPIISFTSTSGVFGKLDTTDFVLCPHRIVSVAGVNFLLLAAPNCFLVNPCNCW